MIQWQNSVWTVGTNFMKRSIAHMNFKELGEENYVKDAVNVALNVLQKQYLICLKTSKIIKIFLEQCMIDV